MPHQPHERIAQNILASLCPFTYLLVQSLTLDYTQQTLNNSRLGGEGLEYSTLLSWSGLAAVLPPDTRTSNDRRHCEAASPWLCR